MRFSLSSKARTLAALQERLCSAKIAPLVFFDIQTWQSNRLACLRNIQQTLTDDTFIVRSSCSREDDIQASNAGAFLSLTNISPDNLASAIDQVIESYGESCATDEVLVQPMLQQTIRSGVAFSHDPNTCAPYRMISWSEGSDTTIVTGGLGGRAWQQAANSPYPPPEELVSVIILLEELLALFGQIPIDCEFAVTIDEEQEVLWLLQARPLVLLHPPETVEAQTARLKLIQDKVERGILPQPFLKGKRTVYGVMPDWNPAEIIGIRPKPLALSLYRDLVTDSIWAYQRHNYGYRNLRSFPLMLHFFGLPYIDVRLSFNSFIPAGFSDELADRLVDYYIDRLINQPTLHDKVEFEIVFSCYTFDLPQKLELLHDLGFSVAECTTIADSLRELTNRIVHPENGLWRADAAKLKTLINRRDQLLQSDTDLLTRIYWLLEDGKRYGTLPFAGLARVGFVALQILKSLIAVDVLSDADYHAFINSVSTVSGQLAHDQAVLDKTAFLSRYGHLRPGTYDILYPRYDKAAELYFDWDCSLEKNNLAPSFSLTLKQMRQIDTLLKTHNLQYDTVTLFDFLQSAIELREQAKFEFTRNLSDVLELIAEFGNQLGFTREQLAYCNISTFQELYVAASDPREIIANDIEQGEIRYRQTQATALPSLITGVQDVWGFEWPETTPNFITQKQVVAPVVTHTQRDKLAGAIVCITNADPGFDWLFSHPIAGFITAWGGVNSHMAIRAGELGLPAIIGAGELLYKRWSNATRLHIDCAGQRVEILA